MKMIVHCDTNVIRDLAEKRGPNAQREIDLILHYVEHGSLVIAPSLEILYELLSSPDVNVSVRIKNAQFYDSVANWRYALKPSNGIIEEDIVSLARQGGPSSPYQAIDERSGFLQALRAGNSILPQNVWVHVVEDSLQQNKQFVCVLFDDFVKRLPDKAKAKLKDHPRETWQSWWDYGGLAEIIADSLDTRRLVQEGRLLLTLPTIRAAIGYILHTWRKQIVDGLKLKPTAHYDFRNAVLSGGVGRIVTEDRKLRNAINDVPNLNVKVWTLNEVIHILNNEVTCHL
jgi:hypothetical protein